MSRPMADTPTRRPRRQFTDEFKAGAVRLVLDEGKTVGAAARDLDLAETALREGNLTGARRVMTRQCAWQYTRVAAGSHFGGDTNTLERTIPQVPEA